jgi:hypothetical protein
LSSIFFEMRKIRKTSFDGYAALRVRNPNRFAWW